MTWVGVPKADLIAQEWFNILETNVERGCTVAHHRESAVRAARAAWAQLERLDLCEGFSRWRAISGAGLAILEGRHREAAAVLAPHPARCTLEPTTAAAAYLRP